MSRVKRGNTARKRHKKILKLAKGFRGSISKLYRPAKQAVLHALSNSYKDRRRKKRDFRGLWIARISAGVAQYDLSYSKFMGLCKAKNVDLNRKMLAHLALEEPAIFEEVINTVKA